MGGGEIVVFMTGVAAVFFVYVGAELQPPCPINLRDFLRFPRQLDSLSWSLTYHQTQWTHESASFNISFRDQLIIKATTCCTTTKLRRLQPLRIPWSSLRLQVLYLAIIDSYPIERNQLSSNIWQACRGRPPSRQLRRERPTCVLRVPKPAVHRP